MEILKQASTGSVIISEPVIHFKDHDLSDLENFLSLQDVHAKEVMPVNNLRLNRDLSLNIGDQNLQMTGPGFQDLCNLAAFNSQNIHKHIERGVEQWLGAANSYLQSCPSSERIKPIIRNEALVALRSPSYALVTNAELFQEIKTQKPDGYQFLGTFYSPWSMRTIFINPDKNINIGADVLHSSFEQKNSETGSSMLRYEWVLYREACTNFALFGRKGMFSVHGVHREGISGGLRSRIPEMLNEFVLKGEKQTKMLETSIPYMMNNFFDDRGEFATEYLRELEKPLGKRHAKGFFEKREANSYYKEWLRVTAVAKNYDISTREEMENIGGWMIHQCCNK